MLNFFMYATIEGNVAKFNVKLFSKGPGPCICEIYDGKEGHLLNIMVAPRDQVFEDFDSDNLAIDDVLAHTILKSLGHSKSQFVTYIIDNESFEAIYSY